MSPRSAVGRARRARHLTLGLQVAERAVHREPTDRPAFSPSEKSQPASRRSNGEGVAEQRLPSRVEAGQPGVAREDPVAALAGEVERPVEPAGRVKPAVLATIGHRLPTTPT